MDVCKLLPKRYKLSLEKSQQISHQELMYYMFFKIFVNTFHKLRFLYLYSQIANENLRSLYL